MYVFGSRLDQEIEKVNGTRKSDTQKRMAQTMLLNKWLGINNFAGVKGPTLAKHKQSKQKR